MKASFLVRQVKSKGIKANIFASTSSLILSELLLGRSKEFSVNSISKTTGVSIGLTHKVISELVDEGIIKAEGVRTAKKYYLIKPEELLKNWLASYKITERCKFFTYNIGISHKEIIKKLSNSKYSSSLALALHSACSQNYKYTNLETSEFYLLKKDSRKELEKFLRLEPIDRGYQFLLIEPYYSKLLKSENEKKTGLAVSPPLLTFLDLYHFPLRGQEQAEYLLRKHPSLAKLSLILKNKKL